MRKLNKIPLSLRQEMIRHLSTDALKRVAGGEPISIQPGCESIVVCNTDTCVPTHLFCPPPEA